MSMYLSYMKVVFMMFTEHHFSQDMYEGVIEVAKKKNRMANRHTILND